MKVKSSYQEVQNRDESLTEQVDGICLGLNYNTCKYAWTSSERLKNKHIQQLSYLYHKLEAFLKQHPEYALAPTQLMIYETAKQIVRKYYHEEN